MMQQQCTEQDFEENAFVESEVEMFWDHTTCNTKCHPEYVTWNKKTKQDDNIRIWSNKF